MIIHVFNCSKVPNIERTCLNVGSALQVDCGQSLGSQKATENLIAFLSSTMAEAVCGRYNEHVLVAQNQRVVTEVLQSLEGLVVDVGIHSSMVVKNLNSHEIGHHRQTQERKSFVQLNQFHYGFVGSGEVLLRDVLLRPQSVLPVFVHFPGGFHHLLLQGRELLVGNPALMDDSRNFFFL